MPNKNRTTIQLEKETRKLLKKMKRYPRESYDYTIKELIKEIKKRRVK